MKACPFCAEQIQDEAIKCRFCGEIVNTSNAQWQAYVRRYKAMPPSEQQAALAAMRPDQRAFVASGAAATMTLPVAPVPKSNAVAALLGLFLGPVGLWYKRQWAAGFAWLVMAIIISIATVGLAAPFFWIGMAIHAAVAATKS